MKNLVCTFLIVISTVLVSCSDKPNEPDDKGEPYYKVIYNYVQPPFSVLTFDSRNGEVLDSAWHGAAPFVDLAFSRNGDFAYGTGYETWMVRTSTGDTIAIDPERGGSELVLSPDEEYLAVLRVGAMRIYELATTEIIYEREINYIWARFHPKKKLLFFLDTNPEPGFDCILYTLDYGVAPPVEDTVAFVDRLGADVPAGPMGFSGDGKWMLMIYFNWLFLVDTDSMNVAQIMKSLHFAEANYTGITVHPDGNRAFLHYYDPYFATGVGGLDIFDFSTQTLTNYIDRAVVPGLEQPFRPWRSEFTPDGKELLGINFRSFLGGSIFRLDVATKTLSQFTAQRGEYPYVLRIDPTVYYDR